jgi:SAM-dependent methyltransferase
MDILKLRAWYRSPIGHMVRRTLQKHIDDSLPNLRGKRILVLGYGAPYIKLWLKEAQVFCGMSARTGSVVWPESGLNRTCLLWDDEMPFADGMFDVVLILHSLEFSDNASAYFSECQRIMKDSGSLLIITPNRLGAWCRLDETPLGLGQPYSIGQLNKELRHTSFAIEKASCGLFTPPYSKEWVLKHSDWFETWGSRFRSPLGGILIVKATKDLHMGTLIRSGNFRQARRVIMPLGEGA